MQGLTLRLFGIILVLLFFSCKEFKKASDFVTNPSAKEKYQRDYKISEGLFQLWEEQAELAITDSLEILLPYSEKGNFAPRSFSVYSYNLNMNTGEKLDIGVETMEPEDLVFIELFFLENDSLKTFTKIAANELGDSFLSEEISKKGTYKIIIQPEIEANSLFILKFRKSPVYMFPVAGMGNRAMQSFWGANRDAGGRKHEGIDIFAPRGTPVVAAIDGRISSSGERGLGGKQVWLRDTKRNQSLYYAHLDSIKPLGNRRVKQGDTLGYVGNTGNAKTTPPHLHFGIYKSYRGATDPLNYIFEIETPVFDDKFEIPETFSLKVSGAQANLRNRPTIKGSEIIGNTTAGDTLQILGKVNDWYHIRTFQDKAAFVHESLVAPLKPMSPD